MTHAASDKVHTISTIDDATRVLLSYSPTLQTGQTYTLERMRLLMRRLDNPQNQLRVVHVAGTSGKTSTSYYVRALLQAYGAKTGLTASPHITSITERVQIDGKPLPDDVFLAYLNEFLQLLTNWPDIRPTYFELLTAFAFWVFSKEHVDYAVVEVGLGGLMDATNVIDAQKVCVITPVGLDHTQILGHTIAEIAHQKAGIISPNSYVFSARQTAEAEGVIRDTCLRRGCVLTTVDLPVDTTSSVPLFQQANFALAQSVVDYVAERDSLRRPSDEKLQRCITQTPPGRFETYIIDGRTVILDGAHNPQKLHAFMRSLTLKHPQPRAWIVGFIAAPDEKLAACIDEIYTPADTYVTTQFTVGQDIKGRKSVGADEVAELLVAHGSYHVTAVHEPLDAFESLLESTQRTIVISGSLYLVAQLRPYIISRAT